MKRFALFLLILIAAIAVFFAPFTFKLAANIYKYGFRTLHAEIEQTVKLRSFTENTYYVYTDVWVKNIVGCAVTLEDSNSSVCKVVDIEGEKSAQMEKALKIKENVDSILFTR